MIRSAAELPVALRPMVVRWPEDAALRASCADRGVCCLLVIHRGSPIPPVVDGEDWIFADSDERDVASRLADLSARPRHPAPGPVPVLPPGLSAVEHRVAVALLQSAGVFVSRAEFPVDDLDEVIAALRLVLAEDGWRILEIGAAGYVLERDEGHGR